MIRLFILTVFLIFLNNCATTTKVYQPKFKKGECSKFNPEKLRPGQRTEGTPILITDISLDNVYYEGLIYYKGKDPLGRSVEALSKLTMFTKRYDDNFIKTKCPVYLSCLSYCADLTSICIQACKKTI